MRLRKNVFIATEKHAILRIVRQVERGVDTACLANIARTYRDKHKDCNMSAFVMVCLLKEIPFVADHALGQNMQSGLHRNTQRRAS